MEKAEKTVKVVQVPGGYMILFFDDSDRSIWTARFFSKSEEEIFEKMSEFFKN